MDLQHVIWVGDTNLSRKNGRREGASILPRREVVCIGKVDRGRQREHGAPSHPAFRLLEKKQSYTAKAADHFAQIGATFPSLAVHDQRMKQTSRTVGDYRRPARNGRR
jgi:hypothetical protein